MQAPVRPLSDVGDPAVGLYLQGAHLVRSRRIRHFMPTTGATIESFSPPRELSGDRWPRQ